MPVVPSYGSPDEYSLQQRQQTYQPRQTFMPGLRPLMPQQATPSLFGEGGGPVMRKAAGGYNSMLTRQQWSSLVTGFHSPWV